MNGILVAYRIGVRHNDNPQTRSNKMSDRLTKIFTVLCSIFGNNSPLNELVLSVFRSISTLRLATVAECTASASEHGSSAHNADMREYFQVRDTRDENVPLILKPVTSEGATLAYALCLDANKVKTLAQCESFAKLFLAKTLASKCSFSALASVCFARQTGEDTVNNLRQTELRIAKKQVLFARQAAPFLSVSVSAADWERFRVALDTDLASYIDARRASL
jgi:hypothetical protein